MTRLTNGSAKFTRPLPQDDGPSEEWDEEVTEDLPEEEQNEPVPPS